MALGNETGQSMRILILDGSASIERALRQKGHEVKNRCLGGGIFCLSAMPEYLEFSPDLVIQQESLGPRCYLSRTDKISCPLVFWAVDSHLNLFWHQWYALLFDVVLTPHVSLFSRLPEGLRPGVLHRLAWPGQAREWTPHALRKYDLGLCARLTRERPMRKALVELLSGRGLHVEESLPFEEMMRFYDNSRIVPNECIAAEVNFRLLEAASAGCLVLGPDVGEDQNALLEPGKEFLVYHDGLEILDLIAWGKMRPQKAEMIGRAAAARILSEHLPEHRARAILEAAARPGGHRLAGAEAGSALWLTMSKQLRNNALPLNIAEHIRLGLDLLRQLGALQDSAREKDGDSGRKTLRELLISEIAGEYLRLGHMAGSAEKCAEDLPDFAADDMQARAVRSAALLQQNKTDEAMRLLAHAGAAGDALPPGRAVESNDNLVARLCVAWANRLAALGKKTTPGLAFLPEKGNLPEDALTYLLYCRHIAPDSSPEIFPCLEAVLRNEPPYLSFYTSLLAEESRRFPEDWRLQLAYGKACIRALEVYEGLMAVDQAARKAAGAGEAEEFSKAI